MTKNLKIALAQINPTVGHIARNADLVRGARAEAAARGADLVAFGELVLCGYPPEDLVLKSAFQVAVAYAVQALAAETADGGPGLLVTAPWRHEDKLHNAVLLLDGGEIAAVRYKHDLPNYGVFDEKRVFAIISHDEGRGKTNSLLEAHRNYFDIQYVIAGADCIGWLPTKMCERVSSEYNPDTDLIFYYDRPETWVHVPAGSFTILMPDDAHAPLATSGSIHKVVVKVQI